MKRTILKTLFAGAAVTALGVGSFALAADQAADEATIRANANKYVE